MSFVSQHRYLGDVGPRRLETDLLYAFTTEGTYHGYWTLFGHASDIVRSRETMGGYHLSLLNS